MPKPFDVPARGTVNYKYIVVEGNFKEDLWVTAAEMRPGDPAVLHHGKVWVRPPGSKWMERAVPGEAYERREPRATSWAGTRIEDGNDILGKFNPGLGAQSFDIGGSAKFVPKGSDLVFELHYTTSGKPAPDVSKLGLVLAKERAADALLLPRRTDGVEPRYSCLATARRKSSASSPWARTRASYTRSRTCICAARTSSCASSTPRASGRPC